MIRRAVIAALERMNLVEPLLALRDRAGHVLSPLRRARARRRYRRLLASDHALLLVHHDRAWDVARRDDRLIVRDVMADNLAMVTAALEQREIPCFAVPIASPNRFRLGVPARLRADALDALLATADPTARLYIDDAGLAARRRRVTLGRRLSARTRARILRRPLWRVYVNRADAQGRSVIGHLHGCEIELWSPSQDAGGRRPHPPWIPARQRPDGRPHPLVPERWNKKAAELPADVRPTGTVEIRDRAYPTIREFTTAPHFDDVTFPIDVVYTWVDGSDPVWLERKNAVLRDLNLATVHPDAHDDSRYRSRDELRYSLRSIEMYADFVRHVYIVTDDQTPAWLNTGDPRVTVVPHKEIFGDAGRLPTFNSHAIEARLHHIEGLAEHYLYLNDDFMFCRRVVPGTFFLSNGLSYLFPSTALVGLTRPRVGRSVDVAAHNSRELILRHFNRVTQQKMKHAPYPQRRSVLYDAEETFADEFARTASNQIRSPSDIPVASAFSHYYAYLTGRAVPGTIAARYVELSSDDFERRLRDLELKRNADTLCVNDAVLDGTPDVARREGRLQEFLDAYWPVKSMFER